MIETRFQFLERLYLPGYMTLQSEDYDKRTGIFRFAPTEPPVTVLSTEYLSPRGAHIFISQACLCLLEYVLEQEGEQEGFYMSVQEYRELTFQSRMKIIELNQRFRRETTLDRSLQGSIALTRVRWGKVPMVKMDFDIANHAFTGNLTGVLKLRPMPQLNADILVRRKK